MIICLLLNGFYLPMNQKDSPKILWQINVEAIQEKLQSNHCYEMTIKINEAIIVETIDYQENNYEYEIDVSELTSLFVDDKMIVEIEFENIKQEIEMQLQDYYMFIKEAEIKVLDKREVELKIVEIKHDNDQIYLKFKLLNDHDLYKVTCDEQLISKDKGYYEYFVNDHQKAVVIKVSDDEQTLYEKKLDLKYVNVQYDLQIDSHLINLNQCKLIINPIVLSDDEQVKKYPYEYKYRIDGSEYQESNEFIVDTNKIYHIEVIDRFYNYAVMDYEVREINQYEPKIVDIAYQVNQQAITLNENKTNQDIMMQFKILDEDHVDEYQIRIYHNEQKLIDDVITSVNYEWLIKANGYYRIEVLDHLIKKTT